MSYPLDTTGNALQNKVLGESATLNLPASRTHLFVVPQFGPYFEDSMVIKYTDLLGNHRILQAGVDYKPGFQFIDATAKCNRAIYGCVELINITITGSLLMNYQTLGGVYELPTLTIAAIQAAEARDPQFTSWEQVTLAQSLTLAVLPTVDHPWSSVNVDVVKRATEELASAGLVVHLRPKFLPQPNNSVFLPSKAEVGLGKVDNYATASQEEAIAGVLSDRFMTPASTRASVQALVQSQLAASGYKVAIPYLAGLVINDPVATYVYEGNVYAPRSSSLPFTSNGTFERSKFVLLTSNTRDSWNKVTVTVQGNEHEIATGAKKFVTGLSFSSRIESRAVLNDVIELVFHSDYHFDNGDLMVEYPLDIGDELVVYVKALKSRMADDRNYYKAFTVINGTGQFVLPDIDFVDAQDLRITLNDFVVLDKDRDYTIVGNLLTVTYTLKLGDLLEIENIDSIPFLGKQQIRSLLLSSKSQTV